LNFNEEIQAMTHTLVDDRLGAKRRRTVLWVAGLAMAGLFFDGYDLVVYGSVLPSFFLAPDGLIFQALSAENQQALAAWQGAGHPPGTPLPSEVQAAQAEAKSLGGLLGSYMMIGVLVGALTAGTLGDWIGRRKLMLASYAWFSVGMFLTALMSTTTGFGWMRFLTGVGVGALVATTGAIVAEFAPPGKKNLVSAVVYAGVPLGSMFSALVAIVALKAIGWQGMFLFGALPLVTVLPLAIWKMPESVAWLVSRGKLDQARMVSERTGVPLPAMQANQPHQPAATAGQGKVGWVGLFSRDLAFSAIVMGLTSGTALLLVYSLNTWLPALMTPLLGATASLALLLVLNGGAAIGGIFASYFADRYGPKPTVAVCFAIGAVAILLVTSTQVVGLLLLIIAIVGVGTTGTQTLIYGMVSNYYRTNVRSAGVAWVAGFGRLGGIGGPLLGGALAIWFAGNLSGVFYVLAGVAALGMLFVLILPRSKVGAPHTLVTVDPSVHVPEKVS
jgi:AAHS family benzoate transporter-like MFS transporter